MRNALSWKAGESMTLWNRRMLWASAENWKAVLNHPQAPLHPRAVRSIKQIIRSRKNPPLIHNGGKP